MPTPTTSQLRHTALHALHLEWGGRMAPFAGHALPISYAGAIEEHRHTRASASLFDVSHMRVCDVVGDDAAAHLDTLTPSRVTGLTVGRSRYLTLTNDHGGVIDDTIVTRLADRVRLVLNASRVAGDLAHLRCALGDDRVRDREDLGLLALQGPRAATVIQDVGVPVDGLAFMQSLEDAINDVPVVVSRSGYTGEDGFEITARTGALETIADLLVSHDAVAPAGLAARDSLRLEAGLCLYGQELDEDTTPVEAGLIWTIPKDCRLGGDYLGADRIAEQVRDGVSRRLVGLRTDGRRPLRAGNPVLTQDGQAVGTVTSGGWGATLEAPVAMAYVDVRAAEIGTVLTADVRGSEVGCHVASLPFVPHRYVRGAR